MHELTAIVLAQQKSKQAGVTTFLATIVNTFGSTYRQKGAKMLLTEQGEMIGTLSGGCVENDILHHSKHTSLSPVLITYDATQADEVIWGFGLGCEGKVQILLERLGESNGFCPVNLISQCFQSKKLGAMATIFAQQGTIKAEIGTRFLIYPDDSTYTNIEDQELLQAIATDTITAKNNQTTTVYEYQLSHGSVQVFIEVIKPPTSLIIFGAGRDALPLVQLAQAIGWEVTIVDCRAQPETYQRFSCADEVILTRREILNQQISVGENTVAVVMTHNYFDDYHIIKYLLPSSIAYLGIMGSKHRINKILTALNPPEKQLHKLYSPIGLNLGANSPSEIAMAIIAEIQAVLNQCDPHFLKDHFQPLHPRNEIIFKQM